MVRVSLSDGIGLLGITLTIILVVLDRAGKLRGHWLYGLLFIAGFMTLVIALGNSWVIGAPEKWRLWRGALMFCVVAFTYSGIAIWISGDVATGSGKTGRTTEQEQTEPGPQVDTARPPEPKPSPPTTKRLLDADASGGKIAAINVANAAFRRDDENHLLDIRIAVENFGDLSTTVRITCDVLTNSSRLPTPSAVPDSLYFAPHQPKTLVQPLQMSKEGYESFLSGNVVVEIEITAEYEEVRGIKRTFFYGGRLNPQTGLLDTIRDELK